MLLSDVDAVLDTTRSAISLALPRVAGPAIAGALFEAGYVRAPFLLAAGFQAAYLDSVATDLPTMPSVKAVVYFDASGPARKWALTPSGTAALARLASSPAVSASG